MKNFFRQYVDKKQLVTGLVILLVGWILSQLFDLVRPAIGGITNQLFKTLLVILTFEVSIPVIPLVVLLVLGSFIVGKTYYSKVMKRGRKETREISAWEATTNKTTPQWTDFKEVYLGEGLLQFVSVRLEPKSEYVRFGFKLLDRAAKLFGDSSILTTENNVLIHIGKEVGQTKLSACYYINGKPAGGIDELGQYITGTELTFSISVDDHNLLSFSANNKEVYSFPIHHEIRRRLYLLAWGDGNPYTIDVKKGQVKVIR